MERTASRGGGEGGGGNGNKLVHKQVDDGW